MRITKKKFNKESFFLIAEAEAIWLIFPYWKEVGRVLIGISDFWDFGGFHSEGGPFYMKPMLMTTQINYCTYQTEVYKPNQLDLPKRIEEFRIEMLRKLDREEICQNEVNLSLNDPQ